MESISSMVEAVEIMDSMLSDWVELGSGSKDASLSKKCRRGPTDAQRNLDVADSRTILAVRAHGDFEDLDETVYENENDTLWLMIPQVPSRSDAVDPIDDDLPSSSDFCVIELR